MSELRNADLRNVFRNLGKIRKRWDSMGEKYPFEIEIPLINSEFVPPLFEDKYGMHRSAVMKVGVRTFGFQKKEDADAFLRDFPRASGKHFLGSIPTLGGSDHG